jgi:hypothetical protein
MIIKKEEFKTFVDETTTEYDNVIDQIISGVAKFVKGYCGNVLEAETDIVEIFDEEDIDTDEIFLANRVNISNIKLYYNSGTSYDPEWTEEDTDKYVSYSEKGKITLLSIRTGRKIYKVTYDAGYEYLSMPDDLKLGALKIASASFNQRKSEGQSAESAEGYSVNFQSSLTDDVKQLLSPYKSLQV